jgi:hypothetical protein
MDWGGSSLEKDVSEATALPPDDVLAAQLENPLSIAQVIDVLEAPFDVQVYGPAITSAMIPAFAMQADFHSGAC